LATDITTIFTLSLIISTIPNDWKKANVSPVYKEGSRSV